MIRRPARLRLSPRNIGRQDKRRADAVEMQQHAPCCTASPRAVVLDGGAGSFDAGAL